MKIGILGGTFDPIHMGHIRLAQNAQSQLHLDKLLLLPAAMPPHKQNRPVTEKQHRFQLVQLAADAYGFDVSDYEFQKDTLSYTIETIQYFNRIYSEDQIVFILGGDSVLTIDLWYRWQDLLSLCEFAAAPRTNQERARVIQKIETLQKKYGAVIHLLEFDPLEVSSSQLRADYDGDKLPPCIIPYIKAHHLYGN